MLCVRLVGKTYKQAAFFYGRAAEQVLAADSLPATFSSIEVAWGKEPLKSSVRRFLVKRTARLNLNSQNYTYLVHTPIICSSSCHKNSSRGVLSMMVLI